MVHLSDLDDSSDIVKAVNTAFTLLLSIIIFVMQPGFAFLEAGSVRAKNTTNILLKNLVTTVIGALMYWATGYAFGYGSNSNPFIGSNKFFLINTDASEFPNFFYNYVFAVTSASILSGAVAERTRLVAYFSFTSLSTGFVYPVITHWAWSENGWLANLGFVDFSGSAVVHITGGSAALVGAILVGPRIGRFKNGRVFPLPGHSVVLVTLGYFLLWFGFFAFNAASEGGIAGIDYNPENVGRAVVNTALSAAGGTFTALMILKIGFMKTNLKIMGKNVRAWTPFGGYWSMCGAINGGITGMVAICAGCFAVEPWAGFVIGTVAGAVYCFWSHFFILANIDDPLNCGAVHLGGGLWGIMAVIIFAHPDRISDIPDGGILYSGSGDAFILFGVQCIGAAVIFAWSFTITGALFFIYRLLGILRVSEAQEEDGLDFKNGEPAYPIDPALLHISSDTGSVDDMSANT